jgi:hypothetical protein
MKAQEMEQLKPLTQFYLGNLVLATAADLVRGMDFDL